MTDVVKRKSWTGQNFVASDSIYQELEKKHSDRNYLYLANLIQNEISIFYDKNEMWWIFDGKKYIYADETDILHLIRDITLDTDLVTRPGPRGSILSALRIEARARIPKEPPINYILTASGIFDIESDSIIQEKTEKYFFRNYIPHKIGYSENIETIDKLISSWLQKEKKELFFEMIAYSMYRRYVIHRLFCFYGASGANGKSSSIRLIRNFLGEDNVSTFSFRLLTDKFQTGKLLGKLVSICTELPYDIVKDTDIIKQLTGDDKLSAEFKGKPCFDFVNFSKIIFSTNSVPPSTDKTRAYSRRWDIIEFPNSFPDGKEITDSIPKEEYENLLFLSLRRLKRIVSEGTLLGEGSREERHRELEIKSNPIQLFVAEYLEDSYDGFIPMFEFTQKFTAFCQSHGYRKHDPKSMWAMLELEGIEQGRNRVNVNGEERQLRGLVGKKWKSVTGVTAVTRPLNSSKIINNENLKEKEMASQTSHVSQEPPTPKEYISKSEKKQAILNYVNSKPGEIDWFYIQIDLHLCENDRELLAELSNDGSLILTKDGKAKKLV